MTRQNHFFPSYFWQTLGIAYLIGSVTFVCADEPPKSSSTLNIMIDDIVDVSTTPRPTTVPPTQPASEFETDVLPDMCSSRCNNPYCCPKQDKAKPWPCGNPYGCAPWQCEANVSRCRPPATILNFWNCEDAAKCKPPGPNPWNCTTPWDCVVPEQVKKIWGCTNPWDCKAEPNNIYNCNKPYECQPPPAIMDCIKNPQPTCANTVGTVQQIPTWLLIIMMMNARKAAPGAVVPNVMQNQSVSWNGQQYVVVNVSLPANTGGIGDPSTINGGTPVRSLNFSDGVAHAFLIIMPLLFVWCNS